jgi:hypothetical protein
MRTTDVDKAVVIKMADSRAKDLAGPFISATATDLFTVLLPLISDIDADLVKACLPPPVDQ